MAGVFFSCQSRAQQSKEAYALCELWLGESRGNEILWRVWQLARSSVSELWCGESAAVQILRGMWDLTESWRAGCTYPAPQA